jgi:hypothetical protein
VALYTATWEGTIPSEDVSITQVHYFIDKTYFVTRVLICNDGPTDLVDVYYNRNVDPDNEAAFGGAYVTTNTIVFQPPTDPDALISAVGPAGCYLGMGARDPNSRVSFGSFMTTGRHSGTSMEWNRPIFRNWCNY